MFDQPTYLTNALPHTVLLNKPVTCVAASATMLIDQRSDRQTNRKTVLLNLFSMFRDKHHYREHFKGFLVDR